MNRRNWIVVLVLFVLPGLAGCKNELNSGRHNNEPISTLVPLSMSTSASTGTETPYPTATLLTSKLPVSKEELITTNGNCRLPCFWGIQPGETKWSDLLQLFDQIGAEGATGLSPRKVETFVSQVDFEHVSVRFDAYRKDDVVGAMIVTLSSRSPLDAMPAEMERYSLKNTFSDLGRPLNLLLQFSLHPEGPSQQQMDYSLWTIYDNDGLQEVYLGDMQNQKTETTICPEQPFEQVML
jgi:hypothetical protein